MWRHKVCFHTKILFCTGEGLTDDPHSVPLTPPFPTLHSLLCSFPRPSQFTQFLRASPLALNEEVPRGASVRVWETHSFSLRTPGIGSDDGSFDIPGGPGFAFFLMA